jgi:hypothetical protein
MQALSLAKITAIGIFYCVSAVHADAPSGTDDRYVGDVIVYTANQGWLSRIYVLDMGGATLHYFEYEYYIFSDLEVVDNDVYVTDWVAPRVYKVDIETGDLEVIVDDWNLLYMYDLAWDGNHFYLKEWSLNRYELDGSWDGSTSFSETVRGGAYDGTYYWTLNDEGNIKCWDISAWPTVTQIPDNAFDPPSTACRGLWFDGQYFWSAERIDGALGWIYRFNHEGAVIDQWLEPAFDGYAACMVSMGLVGDLDGDGDVDIDDYRRVSMCLAGPQTGVPPSCEDADLDGDGDVDVADFAAFQIVFGSG